MPETASFDGILRPTDCPACGYSWHGLPEPRCPECGEAIAPEEIVLRGDPRLTRRAFYLRGTPAHVLRFSHAGFQFGAGAGKGPIYPWPQVRPATSSEGGFLRVKAYRMIGGATFWTVFDVRAACKPEYIEAFLRILEHGRPGLAEDASDPRIFRPGECPLCHYSWEGLAELRCPECGEVVGEEEIILTRDPYLNRTAAFTGENWQREVVECVAITALAGFVQVLVRGADVTLFIVSGALLSALLLIVTLSAWVHRRRGLPASILRLTSNGYQFGAGPRRGRVFPWSAETKVTVSYAQGVLQLRLFRRYRGVNVWPIYKLRMTCGQAFKEGLVRKLREWNVPNLALKVGG